MYFITLDMSSLPFPFPFQIYPSRNLHNIRFDSILLTFQLHIPATPAGAIECPYLNALLIDVKIAENVPVIYTRIRMHAWEAVPCCRSLAFRLLEQVYALCAQLGSNCCSIATRDEEMMELCRRSIEMCRCCRNYYTIKCIALKCNQCVLLLLLVLSQLI